MALFQVFNFVPKSKYGLFKARIVAKNGQLSAWTPWKYIQAGDTSSPSVPTTAMITFTSCVGSLKVRLTDAYIANTLEADVNRFRWYIREKTGTGVVAFDQTWTPTAILNRDDYQFVFPITYVATTYYDIWCIPEDIIGNWDTTPGTAQHSNKQPLDAGSSTTDIAILGWQFTGIFSATDNDTVAWTAGTFTTSNGTTYAISAGNTGNISAVNYIYLDVTVSTTVLQKSTTASDAVGSGKCLIGICQNVADATKKAIYQIFGGTGGLSLTVIQGMLAVDSVGTNELIANSVVAGKLSVATLSAITANMGSLTAGSIIITTGTDKIWLNDGSDGSLQIGGTTKASAPFRVTAAGALTATSATITGSITAINGSIGGFTIGATTITSTNITLDSGNNLIKILTGSQAAKIFIGATSYPTLGFYNIATPDYIYSELTTFNILTNQYGILVLRSSVDGVNHYNYIGMNAEQSSVYSLLTLQLISSADIVLDPAGGDVDIDAADLWLDSGKMLSLNGSTETNYINFSTNLNIVCTSVVDINSHLALSGASKNIRLTAGNAITFDGATETDYIIGGTNSILIKTASTARLTIADAYVESAVALGVASGQKINLEGNAGDSYFIFQNNRIEVFVNNVLEGYIDTTGFVNA